MLVKTYRKGNLGKLLVGMQIGIATMENRMKVSQKNEKQYSAWSRYHTSRCKYKGNEISFLDRYLYSHVHCSTVHSNPVSINEYLDKEGIVYIDIDPIYTIYIYHITYIFDTCCCSVMSNSLWSHGLKHTRLLCPSLSPRVCWNSCPLS